MRIKKYLSILAISALMVIAAGCGEKDRTKAGAGQKINTETTTYIISQEKAENIALEISGGGQVATTELEKDDGVTAYEITIYKDQYKYEFKINAVTGEVIEEGREQIQYGDEKETTTKKSNGAEDTQPATTKQPTTQNIETTASKSETTVKKITYNKAKKIALQAAGGGHITQINLERDNGVYVYDIEIIRGNYEYDFEIDAYTGNIREQSKEPLDYNHYNQSPNTNNKNGKVIGNAKAKQIAIDKVNDSKASIHHFEYDAEDGTYEIELKNGFIEYSVEIDAYTGKILEFEKEIDD